MNKMTKIENSNLEVFDRLESEVRSYVRAFPALFDRGVGTTLTTAEGIEYLDLFGGAGALNYGHNNPAFKQALIDYIERDGIVHSLDLATTAKRDFIEAFERYILKPRNLSYKLQFTGPTGANAVEAALKLARQYTKRANVVAFTGSYHGVSAGSLAATANKEMREAAGVPLGNITLLPYEGYLGESLDTLEYLEKLLVDPNSGFDTPAAVILEAVQGEGGVMPASTQWLKRLRDLTQRHGIVLILDDIQAGIGRTGKFFSFEPSGIVPDLITLSKSLSAYGTPMAMVLIKPEMDIWKPAAHTGTFRGNNLAFITARAALETYWSNTKFEEEIARKSAILSDALNSISKEFSSLELSVRGRGLMFGLVSKKHHELPSLVSKEAFRRRLIIETAGSYGEVLKFMPALTIAEDDLRRGLSIIRDSVSAVFETLS